MIGEVRSLGYDMFLNAEIEPFEDLDLRRYLPNVEVVTVKVEEKAPASVSSSGAGAGSKPGVNVIGILRDSGNILNPVKETEIEAGDVLLPSSAPRSR